MEGLKDLIENCPCIRDAIFQSLTLESLISCRNVCQFWRKSINLNKKIWIRIIKNMISKCEKHPKILDCWKKFLQCLDIRLLRKFASVVHSTYEYCNDSEYCQLFLEHKKSYPKRKLIERIEDFLLCLTPKRWRSKEIQIIYKERNKFRNFSPVQIAILNGDYELCLYLIEMWNDKFRMDKLPSHKVTDILLLFGSMYGNLEIVQLAIEKGATIDITDRIGYSALHYAARLRKIEIFKFLKEMGADELLETNRGECALELWAWHHGIRTFLKMFCGNILLFFPLKIRFCLSDSFIYFCFLSGQYWSRNGEIFLSDVNTFLRPPFGPLTVTTVNLFHRMMFGGRTNLAQQVQNFNALVEVKIFSNQLLIHAILSRILPFSLFSKFRSLIFIWTTILRDFIKIRVNFTKIEQQ